MHLNSAGSAAMGFSAVSIDGSTPAALSGQSAGVPGGPSWLTTTKIAYQNYTSGTIVQSYDTGTTALATLDPNGGNLVAAGGGQWAAQISSTPSIVRTNVGSLGPFTGAALGDVSNNGELAIVTSYPSMVGLTVYDSGGGSIYTDPGVTLIPPASGYVLRIRDHLMVYLTSAGWQMQNVIGGAFAFRPRINEPIFWVVPVTTASGKTFVVEVSDRITVRYADKANGWQLMPLGTLAFSPDIIELSPGVLRIGWSSNIGESPDALVLMDLTVATGANVIWTVSGGVLVPAAGPTLTPTTFQVGPLQGSNTGAGLYPPQQHPMTQSTNIPNRVTDPWEKFFLNMKNQVGANTQAIAALPPVVPQSPAFGIVDPPTGAPILATTPIDTLNVTSSDNSVNVLGNPATKTLDLTVSAVVARGGGVGMLGLEPDEPDTMVIPGPTGPQGDVGPTGAAGASLTIVIPGLDGEDGDTMVIPGDKGDTGATGATGASAPSEIILIAAPFEDETSDLVSIPGPPGTSGVGGGGADFTNAGHPQGVVTAVGGQTCRDTTNGALYLHLPLASSNTGWYLVRMHGAGGAWQLSYFLVEANQFSTTTGNNAAYGMSGATVFNEQGGSPSLSRDANGQFTRWALTTTNFGYWYYNGLDFSLDCDIVWRIRTDPTSVASIRYFFNFGIADPSGDDLSNPAAGFRFSTGASDPGWVGIVHDGTQAVTGNLGSVTAATMYVLRMRKVGNTIYFSVNDGAETAQTSHVPTSGNATQVNLYTSALAGTKGYDFFSFGGTMGNTLGGNQ